MSDSLNIKLTADFLQDDGSTRYDDIGLDVLDEDSRFSSGYFDEHRPEIGADQIGDADALIVLTPAVTRDTLADADRLLSVARFGVGYDAVDVKACTDAGVLLTITSGAVDRPVAEATVGWMIGLGHHVRMKDRLVREGRWDERSDYMGTELRDRTLGLIGVGGIARGVLRLLEPFGMNKPLAFDPFLTEEQADEIGVRKVELAELLESSDYVSIHCPLTEETSGMIGADELARMKPTAYLLNTARGGIVEEDPLYEALRSGGIAGAALDCFEDEPVTSPHRFGELDNVLLAPHSIAWTHELFRDIGRTACRSLVDLAAGRRPNGCVNPEVFDRPAFQEKWNRWTRA